MTGPSLVKTFVQSTDETEPERAFAFWRDAVLSMNGVDTPGMKQVCAFEASRLVARATHSTLLHTQSSAIGVARMAHHIRQDDRDDVGIAIFLRGTGYLEQGNRGAQVVAGDIGIVDLGRPFQAGGYETYEEIRLTTSRAVFRTHVGEPEAFAGRVIRSSPLSTLLANYLRTYAGLVGQMSDAEAGVAVEGALHLIRSFTTVSEGAVSTEALRSLAIVHVERCLHDPDFGPEALCKSLYVSRTRLYAAFANGEGVAASIRDARLDRARRYLSDPAQANESIATLMLRCGFTDPSAFSRAFRRRFGFSGRDEPRMCRSGPERILLAGMTRHAERDGNG